MVKKKATRPLWPGCNKRLVNNYTLHTNTVGRNNTQDKYSLVVNGNSIAATAELLTLNYGTGEVNHLYHIAIGIHSQGKGSLTGVGRNAKRQHFYIANRSSNTGIHRSDCSIGDGNNNRNCHTSNILVCLILQDRLIGHQVLPISHKERLQGIAQLCTTQIRNSIFSFPWCLLKPTACCSTFRKNYR